MSGEHDPNREYDARFPSNVDQRYITWTQYVEFHQGSTGGSTSNTGGFADTPCPPPPISEAEQRRMSELQFQQRIQDDVENSRRQIFHHLVVEAGQDAGAAFDRMVSFEQQFLQKLRRHGSSHYEKCLAAHMRQDPLSNFEDWASRSGRRWWDNLMKEAAKKRKKRTQATPNRAATATKSKSGKAKPGPVLFFLFLGIGFWVILGWLLYRFFIK